ncbi:tetratricopeptide repeat protein [Paenibacillus pini]|uniref:TPR repeat protein n=1 Tax=Paenibacillus pini JCM 16418 TaxID=1236976 RepID=W7Z070_9BACL|nr:tetratricopeptide repeat protein [Paenibacillus pini]GAF10356.1 TPR repeat protein [Paenibacillus pini JCM 16418]
MNTNLRAIELLEANKYDESFMLFKKAVAESRDVQSLTNVAWIYSYEEDDDETALAFILEAINLKPISYFPYSLLGEIYLKQQRWQEASNVLLQSIAIHPSVGAYQNLGVAKYHLRELEEASQYFLRGANDSDQSMYSHVKCLIELGQLGEAQRKLALFSDKDEEFVGEIEVAELYVEIGSFEQAIQWFEKGWQSYWKQPNWVNRFIYSLLQTNNISRAQEIVNDVIQDKNEEIETDHDAEYDEHWTEQDQEEYINQLLLERNEYELILERMSSGYIPVMVFNTSMYTGCYLFGCKRHNHPEYEA